MVKRLRHPDLLVVFFLFLLVFLFLGRVTLGGRALLPTDDLYAFPPWKAYAAEMGVSAPHNELIADQILQNYSWKSFIRESYRQGFFPLWNPYIFSGMPFLAGGQSAALYPLGILFYIMPVHSAYGWFTALHLFLGGLFMYFLVRVLGADRFGALVSAVVFAFSGFLVVSFLWPMVVSAIIWLPLLLAIVELIIRGYEGDKVRKSLSPWLWVIVGGVVMGLQLLAGHMEMSFYVLFTLFFYATSRLLIRLWRRQSWATTFKIGLSLLAMVVLGFALASAQLVPFYELIRENYRAGLVTYHEVIGWALPVKQLLAFLMPDFFGNPTHHSYFDILRWRETPVGQVADVAGNPRSYPFWGVKNYVEGTAYLGILPLLLAGLALILRRDKYTLIFGLYALFSLLLAFGSPLYWLFFHAVPGYQQLHTPFRWIIPYSVSLAVLAGLGASALHQGRNGKKVAFVGGGSVAIGLLLLGGLGLSRIFSGFSLEFVEEIRSRSQALAQAFFSGAILYSYQFRNLFILGLLLLASGVIILLATRRGRARRLFPPLALGLVVADLFAFGYNFNTASSPNLLKLTPQAIAFLEDDPELYRIATFNDDSLRPNSGMLGHLQDIRGYDTVILRRYVDYWRLMEEPRGLLYSQINGLTEASSLGSPLLDLMNVKYVLTTQEVNLPEYTLVYHGEVNIYRNESVLPRAFVVFNEVRATDAAQALAVMGDPSFDPRRTIVVEGASLEPTLPGSGRQLSKANITRYEPNRVTVEVNMPEAGYLVLADSYFSGWRAEAGDRELPLFRANYIFRAVPLSPGQQTVVFRYSPDSFKIGLYGSFIGGVLVLLGLVGLVWRRFYSETRETSMAQRIVKNSITPMAAQLLNRVIEFGFAIFMLRYLGPENVGKYAFAVVLIGYFLILTDFGLGTLLTREVAKDKAQGNRYLSNTIVLRLGLCLVSVPLILGVVGLYRLRFGLASDTAFTVLLFGASLIPSAIAGALSSVFTANEKMEYPAVIAIITALLRVSLSIAVLLLGWGIVGLALVSIVVTTITALIFYILVTRIFFRPALEVDTTLEKEMVTASAPLMVNNFLSTIFFRVDVMLLQPMKGDAATGWYTTAYRFIDGLNVIPAYFTLAIFPIMSRYAETARDSLPHFYNRALKVLLIVSLPITVGTVIIADRIIPFFFGHQYDPAITAIRILIWFLPFSYVNSVTQYLLIALNQQRFLTVAFVVGASFNLAANILIIPRYGFQGAAAVTIVSEIVLMVPFFYAVHRHLGKVPLFSLSWRPVLASAIMGTVLWPLRGLNVLLIIAVAALIYLVVLILLRTFDPDDMALLRQIRAGRGDNY
ncbi:MAG: oligosaccharide flippase family protein [Chloroflexi bacterium]|nr:oligosaccharide flippase family protein [Chloroflexota bacterium]